MAKFKLSKSDEEDICRRWLSGEKNARIAEDYPVGPSTIHNVAIRWGLYEKRKAEKKRLREKAVEMYRQGLSSVQVGHKLGVSSGFVVDHAKNAGVYRGWKRIPPHLEDEALGRWENTNEPVKDIAASYGVSQATLFNLAKKRGLKISRYKRAGSDKKAAVVDDYLRGLSSREVADKHDVGQGSVLLWVKQSGNETRPSDDLTTRRRLACDHGFFKVIDDEAKAYWLGFFAADGCLHKNTVNLSLHEKDRDHVYKFREHLGSEHKISERANNNDWGGSVMVGLSLSSKEMADDLRAHGFTDRKSKTCKPPKIPLPLESHFWRGVTDGDGSIFYSNYHCLSLIGSRPMCDGFRDFLLRAGVKTRANVTSDGRGNWRFSLGGKPAIHAITILYGGAEVYLERKMERAIGVMANGNS